MYTLCMHKTSIKSKVSLVPDTEGFVHEHSWSQDMMSCYIHSQHRTALPAVHSKANEFPCAIWKRMVLELLWYRSTAFLIQVCCGRHMTGSTQVSSIGHKMLDVLSLQPLLQSTVNKCSNSVSTWQVLPIAAWRIAPCSTGKGSLQAWVWSRHMLCLTRREWCNSHSRAGKTQNCHCHTSSICYAQELGVSILTEGFCTCISGWTFQDFEVQSECCPREAECKKNFFTVLLTLSSLLRSTYFLNLSLSEVGLQFSSQSFSLHSGWSVITQIMKNLL